MRIPVFVSSPTQLSKDQEASRRIILRILDQLNLEPRALGRSDYPADLPLREVRVIADHCSGGIILGFNQLTVTAGTRKPGTKEAKAVDEPLLVPTPWNHLEAGILFSLKKPLLVFRESGVTGGVFDPGVSDVFVHNMPAPRRKNSGLLEVFLKWRDRVGTVYYRH